VTCAKWFSSMWYSRAALKLGRIRVVAFFHGHGTCA